MNLAQYEYKTNDNFLEYEFYSDGPNGTIKKLIQFTQINLPLFSYYNLGFGDWNEVEKRIDDFAVSNNQDAERVLATVASAIMDFTIQYPDAIVYAEGSTPARTRRYQMGINKYWEEINVDFEVLGLTENEGFQPFIRCKNYKAFVVKRKFSSFIK